MPRYVGVSYFDFLAILLPSIFPSLFRCLFRSNLVPFCLPNWPPKPSKIDQKSMLKSPPFLLLFFDRFLVGFCSQVAPPKTKKSSKNNWFYSVFCKIGLPKLRSIFGAFLVPTWVHFASQNPPKTLQKPIPRRINFLINFCMVFVSIFRRFGTPTWSYLGP